MINIEAAFAGLPHFDGFPPVAAASALAEALKGDPDWVQLGSGLIVLNAMLETRSAA
jgi:hypothetical protein